MFNKTQGFPLFVQPPNLDGRVRYQCTKLVGLILPQSATPVKVRSQRPSGKEVLCRDLQRVSLHYSVTQRHDLPVLHFPRVADFSPHHPGLLIE